MGLAMLVALPALSMKDRQQKWLSGLFMANVLATPVIAIVYFYPTFSEKLLLLGSIWGLTAPAAMLMLALMFRKRMQRARGLALMETPYRQKNTANAYTPQSLTSDI
jgi:hypothetical protein